MIKKRSLPRLFVSYTRDKGLGFAMRKTFKYLNPRNLKQEYLEIAGIMDGQYAYTGPSFVQLDITNNCNNDCIGCWCNSPLLGDRRITPDVKSQALPVDLVKKLLDELRDLGAKEIYYAGGGEPFVHPDIIEILRYTKKKKFTCYVNTNFTLIDRDTAKELVEMGVDHLTVSIWAGTPGTYSKTHPNKNEDTFRNIKDTLKYLNAVKGNDRKPYIKVYHVVSNLNYKEIREMIDFAIETGSESMEFTVIDTMPYGTDKLALSREEAKELSGACDSIKSGMHGVNFENKVDILNFDHFCRRVDSSYAEEAEYDKGFVDELPCYVGWTFARILADGNVNSCLKSHRFPVGNVYKEKFSNIWNSPRQREFRKNALKPKEGNPFFTLIGNNPELKLGCYKSCDDIGRNLYMQSKIKGLDKANSFLLNNIARYFNLRRYYNDIGRGQKKYS